MTTENVNAVKLFISLLDLSSKNITFGLRSRYRKTPPAAVANQISTKARIPPAHEQKNNKLKCFYLKEN